MDNFYTKDLLADYVAVHGGIIGDYSYGFLRLVHWGEGARLNIGKFCSFAEGITVMMGGNHRADWVTTYPFSGLSNLGWPNAQMITGHPQTRGDLNIGNDVWLGLNCTVMSGITIGDGVCAATGSVITKDVPPYAIVGGNPARILKMRFDDDIIGRLLALKWWDCSDEKINENVELLMSGDVVRLLDVHESE